MKRMTILLLIAWLLLTGATCYLVSEARAEMRKSYIVSYQMKTDGGGFLVGYADLNWNSKTTTSEIMKCIQASCMKRNEKDGQPAPIGDVVILSIVERTWGN